MVDGASMRVVYCRLADPPRNPSLPLRRRLACSDLDTCLWTGAEHFRAEYSVASGFVAIDFAGINQLREYEGSRRRGTRWWAIGLPECRGAHATTLRPDDEAVLALAERTPQDSGDTLGLPPSCQAAGSTFLYLRNDTVMGALVLYGEPPSEGEPLMHDAGVFFRRVCEEINARFVRHVWDVKHFEQEVTTCADVDGVRKLLLDFAIRTTEATGGSVAEAARLRSQLQITTISEEWRERSPGLLHQSLKEGSFGVRAARRGKTLITGDWRRAEEFERFEGCDSFTSMMATPVVFQDVALGVVCLEHKDADHFFELDAVAVELLAGKAAPFIADAMRDRAFGRIHEAGDGATTAASTWRDLIDRVVSDTGVDFGTLQLISRRGGYIETVAASRTVPHAFTQASRHLLWEKDIQVDVWSKKRVEVVAGEDPRFDPFIYGEFSHAPLVRMWFPLLVTHRPGEAVSPVAARLLDQMSDSPRTPTSRREVYDLQLPADVACIGTVELGFNHASAETFDRPSIERILELGRDLTEGLLKTLLRGTYGAILDEILGLTRATWASIHTDQKSTGDFAVSVSLADPVQRDIPPDHWARAEAIAGKLLEEPLVEKNRCQEVGGQGASHDLSRLDLETLLWVPLHRGILLVGYSRSKRPSRYERSLIEFLSAEASRLMAHIERHRAIDSRERTLSVVETLGDFLHRTGDFDKYAQYLCVFVTRMLAVGATALYTRDNSTSEFIRSALYQNSGWDYSRIEEVERADVEAVQAGGATPLASVAILPVDSSTHRLLRVSIPEDPARRPSTRQTSPRALVYVRLLTPLSDERALKLQARSLSVALSRTLSLHDRRTRTVKHAEVLRNIANLNPADGQDAVFEHGAAGLKLLTGYRGCAFFFLDVARNELLMEWHDDSAGMFKKNGSIPQRVPLRKVRMRELQAATDAEGRVLVRVSSLSGDDLGQDPLSTFPVREGAEVIIVHPRPGSPERDYAMDTHQIAIVRDLSVPMDPTDPEFIGNLGVHLHMGVRLAREWSRFGLSNKMDELLPSSTDENDAFQRAAQALSGWIDGKKTTLVFAVDSDDEGVADDSVKPRQISLRATVTDTPLVPGSLRSTSHFQTLRAILADLDGTSTNPLPERALMDKILGDPDAPGYAAFAVPIHDPDTRRTLGYILCLRDDDRSRGFSPFQRALAQAAAGKLGSQVIQRRKEVRLSLRAAELGHAVKSPLQGIVAAADESLRLLSGKEPLAAVSTTTSYLTDIAALVASADEAVLVALGSAESVQTVAVGQLMKSVALRLKLVARARDLVLEVHPSAFQTPRVRLNSAKLETILVALLDNAIKFAAPKTTVELSAKGLRSGGWRFTVSNVGRGIPIADRTRIYEPGFQGVAQRGGRYARGSGLGLYVARQISKDLGIHLDHDCGTYSHAWDLVRFMIDVPGKMFL